MAKEFENLQDKFNNADSIRKNNSPDKITLYSDFDELKMYFGHDYWVTDKICVHNPTIGDILEFGDNQFYAMAMALCGDATFHRLALWKAGIDWNKTADFDVFGYVIHGMKPEHTKLLFGDLNLSWFEKFHNNIKECDEYIYIPRDEDGNLIQVDYEKTIVIDWYVYHKLITYLRTLLDIHPKAEFARNKATKESMIWEDEEKEKARAIQKKKHPYEKSYLLPLVSALVNHPGFKYKTNELKQLNIYQFMDSVRRLQVYENTTALLKGMYSGFVDGSQIHERDVNWLRDLS